MPATPRLSGRVERSLRMDGEEFYKLLEAKIIDDTNQLNKTLQEGENYYNYDRAHGGTGGRALFEIMLDVTKA